MSRVEKAPVELTTCFPMTVSLLTCSHCSMSFVLFSAIRGVEHDILHEDFWPQASTNYCPHCGAPWSQKETN
jgi:hypothetical protein